LKSHLFDAPQVLPQAHFTGISSTIRPLVSALIGLSLIQGCLSRASQIEDSKAASAANQNTVIPLEISARIEGLASLGQGQGTATAKVNGNNASSEIRFRDSGEIGPNQTLRISQLPSDSQQASSTPKPAGEDYQMEVRAVSVNTDNVVLEIEVFNYDKMGKRVSISQPRLVVQYGDSAEIQELNAAPNALFSRLSLSVLPSKPRPASETEPENTKQNTTQETDSGASK
jgi:hypothetical protein